MADGDFLTEGVGLGSTRVTKLATPAQAAAAIEPFLTPSEGGGGGHLHGMTRLVADGVATAFNLLDFAEYLEMVAVNGLIEDPLTHSLSADRSQVVFDTAPPDGQVLVITYVIAGI